MEVTEGFSFNKEEHEALKAKYFADRKEKSVREILRPHFTSGAYIANQNFDIESANKAIENGEADLISFGWLFVTDDNVVEKIQKGEKFNSTANVKDQSKVAEYLYSHKPEGYSDVSVY